jgi:hypothetical protein
MNPIKLIAFATASVATVAYAAVDCVKIHKTEKKKREEIALETQKQIAAIHRAGSQVDMDIKSGRYDRGFDMNQVLNDLRFYTMTERLES